MPFFSKFLLLGLTIISYSDCFMLQPYKLIKPSKLSRSNTPLYLSNKNKNSSNYLKLNDDDGSSFNNKNLFFNLSEYNFKLHQFLNLSENDNGNDNVNGNAYDNNNDNNDNVNDNVNDNANDINKNITLASNNNNNDFYYKPVHMFGLSEYDFILLKIVIITLINAYIIALIVDFSLYQLLLIH
jgi:hypothetical protein